MFLHTRKLYIKIGAPQNISIAPLIVGCRKGHKLLPLNYIRWNMSQAKTSRYTLNKYFPKMFLVSVSLGSLYRTDICLSVHFSDLLV